MDGYKNYAAKFGGQGIKLICDEGLMCINNLTLEKGGYIDENYLLSYGDLYPIPDYSSWDPQYINNFVSQWRLNPYGSMMVDEYFYIISGGAIYYISYSRTSNPAVYFSNFTGEPAGTYKFSPIMCETGRTPTSDSGKNLHAGWDGSYMEFVFDENSGKFLVFDWGDMYEVDSNGKSFPGYKAFYGEDTYQYELCFAAITNGSNIKFTTFNTS